MKKLPRNGGAGSLPRTRNFARKKITLEDWNGVAGSSSQENCPTQSNRVRPQKPSAERGLASRLEAFFGPASQNFESGHIRFDLLDSREVRRIRLRGMAAQDSHFTVIRRIEVPWQFSCLHGERASAKLGRTVAESWRTVPRSPQCSRPGSAQVSCGANCRPYIGARC